MLVHLVKEWAVINQDKAMDVYTNWFLKQSSTELDDSLGEVFELLWQYSSNPTVNRTLEWIFNASESSWNPLVQVDKKITLHLISSPLIELPSFQKQVLRILNNNDVAGLIIINPIKRSMAFYFGHDFRVCPLAEAPQAPYIQRNPQKQPKRESPIGITYWLESVCPEYDGLDLDCPEVEKKIEYRWSDLYAFLISRKIKGAPTFRLYWTEEKKDDGLSAMKNFLKNNINKKCHIEEETNFFECQYFM